MAIPNIEKAGMTRSIYGYIGRGVTDEREIGYRLSIKYDFDVDREWLTVLGMIRRAQQSANRGDALDFNLADRPRGTEVPLDYALYGTDGAYGYRVRVNLVNGSGERWDTVILISSDNPLTGQEVLSMAQDLAQDIARTGATTNPGERERAGSGVVSLNILSVGRRP